MKHRARFELPQALEPVMRRAQRLEWLTLGAMAVIVIMLYAVMGGSQAMKAAWVEDLLSFVAPAAFLVSTRYRDRAPNSRFPYGYHRCVSIAFLSGAVALTIVGVFILTDSIVSLVSTTRPSIGGTEVCGRVIWSGWIMIAVLLASALPPFVLGRMKLKLARELHDKTLKADADMNKADWLTALAGIVGVTGISFGFWWADAAAGAFISLTVVNDGVHNLRQVVANLMDSRPMTLEGAESAVPRQVQEAVHGLPWVRRVEVRLREEGHVFTGELFIGALEVSGLQAKTEEAQEVGRAVDWRVHDLVIQIEEAT